MHHSFIDHVGSLLSKWCEKKTINPWTFYLSLWKTDENDRVYECNYKMDVREDDSCTGKQRSHFLELIEFQYFQLRFKFI